MKLLPAVPPLPRGVPPEAAERGALLERGVRGVPADRGVVREVSFPLSECGAAAAALGVFAADSSFARSAASSVVGCARASSMSGSAGAASVVSSPVVDEAPAAA